MMEGKVLFFGRLADVAGAAEWSMPAFSGTIDEDAFISMIANRRPELIAALKKPTTRICVNQVLHPPAAKVLITAADEVAFLPPMSGG